MKRLPELNFIMCQVVLTTIFFLLSTLPAQALPERLDDSASPRGMVQAPRVLSNTGGLLEDSLDATHAILEFGRVEYRLNTAAFIGQQARIYYVIPADVTGLLSPSGLDVSWYGNGLFANGSGHPGDRVLVWSGSVESGMLSESLNLTMRLALQELRLPDGANFGLESFFEIETLP